MSESRKPNVVPWIAGITLMLLGAYVGVYYWLVAPRKAPPPMPFDYVPEWYDAPRLSTPDSVFDVQRRLSCFFAPIHRLDRHLRPHVWEPKP